MQVPTHVAKHVGFVVVLPQSNKTLRLYILFLEICVHFGVMCWASEASRYANFSKTFVEGLRRM